MTAKTYKVLNLETMKTTRKADKGTVASFELDKVNKDLSKVSESEIM